MQGLELRNVSELFSTNEYVHFLSPRNFVRSYYFDDDDDDDDDYYY